MNLFHAYVCIRKQSQGRQTINNTHHLHANRDYFANRLETGKMLLNGYWFNSDNPFGCVAGKVFRIEG